MSTQKASKDEKRPQATSASVQSPLTSENLVNHDERDMPSAPPSWVRMQRWLAETSDTHAQSRTSDATNYWDQLKEIDEVAAAIERAASGGGA